MAKLTVNKSSYVISYILIVLLIIGIVGVIAYFTSGFSSDFKTFIVQYNGEQILNKKENIIISDSKPIKASVKYPFKKDDNQGYYIKVVPNNIIDKDFEILLGDTTTTFQQEEDLTNGFIIDKKASSFSISPVGKLNEVLQAVHPNVEIADYRNKAYPNMFSLLIYSFDKKEHVTINFSIEDDVFVSDIIIDPGVVLL